MGGELVAEYPANGATNTPQMEYGYRGGELLIEGVAMSCAGKFQIIWEVRECP